MPVILRISEVYEIGEGTLYDAYITGMHLIECIFGNLFVIVFLG